MSQNDDPDAILELAARLQLQDIDEWRAAQKGKGRAGLLSDVETSFNMAEAEHKATIQRITDGRIARSAERAMNQDRALIESFTAMEERERADRRLALTLSVDPKAELLLPGPASAVTSAPGSLYAQSENPSLASVRADSVISSIAGSFPADSPEGSVQSFGSYQSSNGSVNVTKPVPSILILAGGRPEAECVICRDTVTRAYQAPCGCFYDRECLINLFERAAVDESLFPPRCCNLQIPFQVVRVIFTSKLIRAFERKTKEFETPNRLYCHKPRCSAFLGPAVGNQRQRSNKECTACYRRTCTFCKGVGHPPGVPCQTNADTQQILTLGRKEGWQSCPSCHNLVELALGCYHMTCRCKHQFCYLCEQQWKSCTCPQWDESRLLIQAEQRVARNQGTLPLTAGPAQVVARGVQVNQAAEALRQNHQCAHHTFGFSRQPGPGKCESCGIRMQETILRCRAVAHMIEWLILDDSHPLSLTLTMNQDADFEVLLELTAQLQLQDIEEWRASQKGKGRVGVLSEVEMTLNAIEDEHKATLRSIADRRITRSAERAVSEDLDLIEALAAIEEQEQEDRRLALMLSENPNTQIPLSSTSVSTNTSRFRSPYGLSENPSMDSLESYPGSVTSRLGRLSLGSSRTSVGSNYLKPPNASSFVPSILRLAGGRSTADCVICSDTVTQAYQAPCGCFYDRDCLTELFQRATVDESLFPPRCCSRQISFQEVRSVLAPDLVRTFERKAQEFKTPNRLYCHHPQCSAFLGSAVVNEREKANKQCTTCYRQTCTFCKAVGHESYVPCSTDAAAQQVLALGQREGWQSCPSCHNMVELSVGCYHMTCRCRHEFCYLCAQQWKNCTCPQWDEDRLIAQAERRVVRDQGVLPAAPAPAQLFARAMEVRRAADALRENHDCAHHASGFAKRGGSGNCESCGNWLRDYLLRCRGCGILVCVRCRRNRL